MSTNHLTVEKIFPEAYQGTVSTPNQGDIDIARRADSFDMPPIYRRFGVWVITKNGIENLFIRYHIAVDRLDEVDWDAHLKEKVWVTDDVLSDFLKARHMAELMHDEEII